MLIICVLSFWTIQRELFTLCSWCILSIWKVVCVCVRAHVCVRGCRYKRTSLRVLGTVGEPINPEAWLWYHRVVGNSQCAIVDTFWQTETVSEGFSVSCSKIWLDLLQSACMLFHEMIDICSNAGFLNQFEGAPCFCCMNQDDVLSTFDIMWFCFHWEVFSWVQYIVYYLQGEIQLWHQK